MAKTYLGVDIGYDTLKLALVSGGRVKKTASVPMPKNLMKSGRVVSIESMGELISATMKENGIHCRNAAYVMPIESTFIKNVTMPQMNADQLLYNLPYEFHDYISGELQHYVFDYAMISSPEDIASGTDSDDGTAPSMDLLAVGAAKETMDEIRALMRKAGLKLAKAAPAMCSYSALIRAVDPQAANSDQEYCIIDLGYNAIRMYMYRGDRHVVDRVLEIGLSILDDVLAEAYGVDVHLAHTYLLMNYEDCQRREECLSAYDNIAVELMRALNFYRFSNPSSQLNDIVLCGGGAVIEPLRNAIADTLDMDVHRAQELIPGNNVENCNAFVQAIGITME